MPVYPSHGRYRWSYTVKRLLRMLLHTSQLWCQFCIFQSEITVDELQIVRSASSWAIYTSQIGSWATCLNCEDSETLCYIFYLGLVKTTCVELEVV
jgi:hypothetical protein